MNSFKKYMSEEDDIKDTLSKLPKGHSNLVKGFKVKFEPNNTLKGDKGHVGVVKTCPSKQITIASPWNYSRSFVLIHEIGHLVWNQFMTPELKDKWGDLIKANKDRKKEEPEEEQFAHAYAATYAKHPPMTHFDPTWVKFIKALPS